MSTDSVAAVRKYEGVVIMHPDASEDEQKALFRKNVEIIKNFKGELNHLDTWGRRRLSNPIKKLNRGNYFHVTFTGKGEVIAELERTMRINDRILRFAHVRLDDRTSLPKFVEEFKSALTETLKRESEREAKSIARRQQAMQNRDGGGGFREGRDGGGRDGGGREGGGFREGGRGRRDEGGGGRGFDGGDDGDME